MAAATVASVRQAKAGNFRSQYYRLTAPADSNTLETGLAEVLHVNITMIGATIAAADAVGVTSISGGTITFEVVGTARNLMVEVIGV